MKQARVALTGAVLLLFTVVLVVANVGGETEVAPAAPAPVLSVGVTRAEQGLFPMRVPASGNIAAWQEASVGAEADGLRLTEVRVNVGDTVVRGQVLALFNADIVAAELAEAQAALAQVNAEILEAEANAQRAQSLAGSGALSAQQINQYLVAAMTARARREAARAVERRQRLRLAQTRVLAPGDGIVTARTATVGAVVPAGQELFRMIRDGRLEWRAAVAMADLHKLAPGQRAELSVQGHAPVQGTLRMLAPAIDAQTHNGLVYVDLPRDSALRAGSFARGHLDIGEGLALTLPQSAVLLRDGFSYVMQVGPQSTVMMKKVSVGRRHGDRIEVTEGLAASEDVIAAGLGFLSEGDTVRVVSGRAADTARSQGVPAPAQAAAVASPRSGS